MWHGYSTNDVLSNDTKVNDLVNFTLTLKVKIALKKSHVFQQLFGVHAPYIL